MAGPDLFGIEIELDDRSVGEIRQLGEAMKNLSIGDVVVSMSGTRRKVLEVIDASGMHYRFEVTRTDGSLSEQELSARDIDETAIDQIIKTGNRL